MSEWIRRRVVRNVARKVLLLKPFSEIHRGHPLLVELEKEEMAQRRRRRA